MIQINECTRLRDYLNDIFVRHTGREKSVIERDTDRDFFLTAQQAVSYGLVDAVLEREKALPVPITTGIALPVR
jgi:ATP-dependent Clp protease protease subunit